MSRKAVRSPLVGRVRRGSVILVMEGFSNVTVVFERSCVRRKAAYHRQVP